ncbi:voltage-dependent calcium channel type A subunit alpha-1 [Halyomorpha halys]|uniref:voltage-dependent calcium channel type A subunit alpha-1 n=1 Tax=Halyomorpha halys TaxID=286706 RepID=UPI0006D518FA|nr:voltage-dependent calcium channel type A subunit alpha-1 [Halyomorpha halys]
MTDDAQDQSSQYNSLFIFKDSNPIRKQCKAVVTWAPFEYIILLVIVVNCIGLGFGLYLPEENETAQLLEKAEIYFLIIFILEMVLKVIAFGFALHPGSYLRNPWNLIDFFVIVIGIVSLFPLGIELDVLRMLRVFRLLRLIRFIKIIRSKN